MQQQFFVLAMAEMRKFTETVHYRCRNSPSKYILNLVSHAIEDLFKKPVYQNFKNPFFPCSPIPVKLL
jgi:hypothetical protein